MNRAGGVVAALAANAVAIAVLFTAIDIVRLSETNRAEFLSAIPAYILFGTPLALIVALLAGLPLAMRLEQRHRTRAIDFLLLGLVLGMLPFFLYGAYVIAYELLTWQYGAGDERWGLLTTLRRWAQDAPRAAIMLGLGAWCGAWSALAYWWIAVRALPRNRTEAKR